MSDRIFVNEFIPSEGLTSNDGYSRFVFQGDGNLVLYRATGSAPFATGVGSAAAAFLQNDGTLNSVFDSNSGLVTVWTSGPANPISDEYFLVVQDDGNVVIYGPTGPVWATNTVIVQTAVPGFLPSSSGFRFPNNFPAGTPDVTIGTLRLGDASNGCSVWRSRAARAAAGS